MKDYKEVADDVFQRSEKIIADNRRRKNKIMKAGSMTVCFCLIALLCIGVWQSGVLSNMTSDETIGGYSHSCSGDVTQTPQPMAPYPAQAGDTRAETWLTAEELGMVTPEGTVIGGLNVPTFVSYRGSFYGIVDTDGMDSSRFSLSEGESLLFNTHYTHNVYLVEDHPDWIAIHINGMEVYEKIFDVTFEVDETTYAIAYSPVMNADYSLGDVVFETDDYIIYEAVKLQGEPAHTKEYIVDILPLLQRKLPNLFDGSTLEPGDDYGEQWQLALPME